jgi:L-fucose dehydrogenase
MELELQRKVAIITGGANGIGADIVRTLSEEGAIPVIVDIDRAGGESLLNDIGHLGPSIFVQCDVTQEDQCKEVIQKTLHAYNCIDILVNNAGNNDRVGLDGTVDQFRKSLDLNLTPYFSMTQKAWKYLKIREGNVVNIGSKVAITGQGGTSGYAAAKGGVLALTREWAVEGAPHNVRVNAVIPAEVDTEMHKKYLQQESGDPVAERRTIEQLIPLGHRMTKPIEIATQVAILASNTASSHTTGQHIYVDGGYTHLDRRLTVNQP